MKPQAFGAILIDIPVALHPEYASKCRFIGNEKAGLTKMKKSKQLFLVAILFTMCSLSNLAAQQAPPPETNSTQSLQKATQNPVANLISVPIQNNFNLGVGSYSRTQDVLNTQPVIPTKLNEQWNLISRIIQPIVWQPYSTAATGGEYGLGDMNPTFFLSPGKPGKIIWGVGPAFVIPTATNSILGQGKFSIGPSVVALSQPGHWTIGVLVNNVWSVAGSGSRPAVNQMLLQYFLNYNMKKGWFVSLSPIKRRIGTPAAATSGLYPSAGA